jgi:tRNA nucleotidyltransferase (CCA-adding enzyme)
MAASTVENLNPLICIPFSNAKICSKNCISIESKLSPWFPSGLSSDTILNMPATLKLISGGQTGADRAGLDAALRHGIAAGGYCPRGRRAEDGTIPPRYPLMETDSPDYAVRTRMNVRKADGTLILNLGALDGGTRLTAEYAAKRNKPYLVVNLDSKNHTPAHVADWLAKHDISMLNIAGPRESKRPGIYRIALAFLELLLRILSSRAGKETQLRTTKYLKTVFPAARYNDIFLVGGIVRDTLMGKANQDIDIVAAVPEGELRDQGFHLVQGKTTAPIMFRNDPVFGKIEVTIIPRIELLANDLANRDFTCNALAMSLEGELIDPLCGKRDLQRKKLRACTPLVFNNDPIRIFRAFRFEADGWTMTQATEILIRQSTGIETMATIPVERFSREMVKALAGTDPARFFKRMLESGTGTCYLPELFRMPLIPAGPIEHHPEGDLFSHSCQVLTRVSVATSEPLARFCAFFHDLGKLATNPEHYPKHHGHDDAGFEMATAFCDRLKLPTAWKRALTWTSRLHGNANNWEELRDSTRIRMAEQAIKSGITEILPLVSAADKPQPAVMPGWPETLRIAEMTTEELGIAPLQLEMMAPKHRGEFILQKRIETLRRSHKQSRR